MYALSGVILIELVLGAPDQSHFWSASAAFLVIGTLLAACLSGGRLHGLLRRLIRIVTRKREVSGKDIGIEMKRII